MLSMQSTEDILLRLNCILSDFRGNSYLTKEADALVKELKARGYRLVAKCKGGNYNDRN